MGEQSYHGSKKARRIFNTGSEVLEVDLAEVCFGSETDSLKGKIVQPALVAAILADHAYLTERSLRTDLLLPHSVSEFAALAAAKAIGYRDTFRIMKKRAEVTEASSISKPGVMAAVLGLEEEQVIRILASTNYKLERIKSQGKAYLANQNWSFENVLSGHPDAVARFGRIIDRLKGIGSVAKVRLVPLTKIPGAFHSPHNDEGVEEFREVIKSVRRRRPQIPILGNNGNYLEDPRIYPEYLSQQLVEGVDFRLMMHVAVGDGIRQFMETGPGKKPLNGFVKKEFPNHEVIDAPLGEIIRVLRVPEVPENIRLRLEKLAA